MPKQLKVSDNSEPKTATDLQVWIGSINLRYWLCLQHDQDVDSFAPVAIVSNNN